VQKSQPADNSPDPAWPAKVDVARRKNPWLLALSVLLVVGWLMFLAAMAFHG
jgi:hypothetical protein